MTLFTSPLKFISKFSDGLGQFGVVFPRAKTFSDGFRCCEFFFFLGGGGRIKSQQKQYAVSQNYSIYLVKCDVKSCDQTCTIVSEAAVCSCDALHDLNSDGTTCDDKRNQHFLFFLFCSGK